MHRWARAASVAPWLANAVTQTPGLRTIAKAIVHMAPQRRIPKFASQTFRASFRRRAAQRTAQNAGKPPVILWPDTWNNHFHPQTALAAADVLEAAGFQVTIPHNALCCGRPLYDYGMLDEAKQLLLEILDELRPQLRAGVSIVGLEPSCVSVFRNELAGLLPNDEDAKRLRDQTFLLTEFLAKQAPGFTVPALTGRAVVHGHCHQTSVLDFDSERAMFDKLSLDYTVLDSGCCGMAGAFGFDKGEHYDVSIACAERVLLPAVREAGGDTLIVANGFSCREQIAQTTQRRAINVADVIKLALDQSSRNAHE
jgi:Fe-S oxidoreductase